MQLKALVAMLVLGSSSVALADTQLRDHRRPTTVTTTTVVAPAPIAPAPVVIAHPIKLDARIGASLGSNRRPIMHPVTRPLTWVSLANNLALDGRALIKLQPTSRRFSKLELRADGNGRTKVDKVVVYFGNGRSQTVALDAKLGKKQPSIMIDLKGESRTIERVILVGRSNGRNASVDVRAL